MAPANSGATIWRYLDFTKFVALLDSRELFFAPIASFEDRFEGSYTSRNIAGREEFWMRNFGSDDPSSMAGSHAEIARELPRWIFASCWSLSEAESTAFWGLYVPPSGGVAVRSSYQHLADCFDKPAVVAERAVDPLYIGTVSYVDYESHLIPEHDLLYPFVHKRRSFEFESELRAVISHFPDSDDPEGWVGPEEFKESSPPDGLTVQVDLQCLVDAVYVSPTAPSWFFDLVSSVVDRYDCDAPVIQSSLADNPLF